MELSVVILNYNVRNFLEQCIRSVQVALKALDAEIIVIDNNSPDDSAEMMRTVFPKITFIHNKINVGFSKANNQAVKVAKGKYICILNPDTAVSEDTFIKTLEYYKNVQKIGALGVRLMDGTGNFLPESKRNLPTPWVSMLKLIGKGDKYYAAHIQDNENGAVDVLVGAFMLVEKRIYEEVGGFDEDYFMYGEDIDLSYKFLKAGYQNHYYGATTVLHYKGESTKKDQSYYDRFYGAMQIFYRKHFSPNLLLEKIVSAGVYLAKLKSKYSGGGSKKMNQKIKLYLVAGVEPNTIQKLEEKFKQEFRDLESEENPSNGLIVFDARQLGYGEIFKTMDRLKNRNNQFRIHPANTNFILGSDRSDEKGVVMRF